MSLDSAQLTSLYASSPLAKSLLDCFAGYAYRMGETSVERAIALVADASERPNRQAVIKVFKALEEAGAGKLVPGRGGAKTRIVWDVPLYEVGKLAAGEQLDRGGDDSDPSTDASPTHTHAFLLRPDLVVELDLPVDLTANEAARLSTWVGVLATDEQ